MGYSNVQGALNVLSSTSTDSLFVRGDATINGNLTASSGFHSFGNLSVGNLLVTGNFTVTATNTQTTNALSINNAGTATALKVVQFEGGGPGHTYNVAEFWDFQTLAMVIDAEGNVGIHTTSSPGYSLTVGDGSYLTTVTSQLFSGNGSGLSNIQTTSLIGPVTALQLATNQTNITSVGTLTGLNVQGLLVASNASGASNLNSANLVGNVAQANIALVVSQAAQPNITSVGTLTGLNVQGLLIASDGSGIAGLNSANLVGNVAKSNIALVVSQAAQPNVTSLGTLTGLNVQGLLVANNASGASNLNSANLVGNVAQANIALVVSQAAQPNITSVGTAGATFTVSGLLVAGNASAASNLNSSNLVGNVAQANIALVVSQAAQPNITSVGTLTTLNVAGNSNVASTLYTTNIVSAGFTSNATNTVFNFDTLTIPFISSTTLNVATTANIVGPVVMAGLLVASNASAASNLNSSNLVGNVAQANIALVVSQPSQPNITSVGTTATTFSVSGLLIASNASGASNLNSSNLVGNVAKSNIALVVSQASQPNVTSLGTLTGLNVQGLLIASDGSGIAGLNSANLVGNVAKSNIALVVSQAAQPNVTSLGTLTGLNVQGLLIASDGSGVAGLNSANLVGNVAKSNIALVVSQASQPNVTSLGTLTGLNVQGLLIASDGSGIAGLNSANLVGNVAKSNIALVVSQASQPNITSVGTLTSLNVSGTSNATIGSFANIYTTNIVGFVGSQWTGSIGNPLYYVSSVGLGTSAPFGSNLGVTGNVYVSGQVAGGYFTGGGNGLSNVLSSVLVGNVANANVALVVSQNAQPNITSVGTLTSLNVSGTSNATIGSFANIYTTNIVGFVGSQWTGSIGGPLYYVSSVGLGTSAPFGSNLGVTGNVYVSGQVAGGYFTGSGNGLTNVLSSVLVGNVANANVALVVSQNAQPNITSVGTLGSLVVSGTANVQTTLNAASISTPVQVPANTGLFMNLNATYTLNSTGNWTGNIAGSVTSNLYTLFAPNPLASWTTYGTNPIVTGPSANGSFRFNQTGPYVFTVVISADYNIKTFALSSNTSDIHSNVADPGTWLYCYRIGVGQNPSTPVTIPFFVDSTSKYYWLDFEAMRRDDNIHRTWYTNVTSEGYTGSYVILRPV